MVFWDKYFGLELPFVIRQLGTISLCSAVWYGFIVSFVLIVTRLLCTLGTSVFMRFMSRFIAVSDPNLGWRGPLIFGWAGMRGVVSLAFALSIPILTQAGQPEIVGIHVGERSWEGAKELWQSLPALYRQCAVCYTDFWSAYEELPQKK